MKSISACAELLYVVSNFEKGRIRSSGIWRKKYVKSLNDSLEIMELLVNLISTNQEITQDQVHFLQEFIQKNIGVIFSNEGNINALLAGKNDSILLSGSFEEAVKLINDIILEIKNLLCTKNKNYKTKISYLLKAFHNLPKIFLNPNDVTVFNLSIQPIAQHEAIQYAYSYLSLKDELS